MADSVLRRREPAYAVRRAAAALSGRSTRRQEAAAAPTRGAMSAVRRRARSPAQPPHVPAQQRGEHDHHQHDASTSNAHATTSASIPLPLIRRARPRTCQRLPRPLAHLRRQLGRLDHPRRTAQPQHQPHQPHRVGVAHAPGPGSRPGPAAVRRPSVRSRPPGSTRPPSARRAPAAARPGGARGARLEHARRQVRRLGLRRWRRRARRARRRRPPGPAGTAAPPPRGGTTPPGSRGPRRAAAASGRRCAASDVVAARGVVADAQRPARRQRPLRTVGGGGLLLAGSRSTATPPSCPRRRPPARSCRRPPHRVRCRPCPARRPACAARQQRGGLRGGQPQRAAHAGVLGDGDGVARERQVDQVARAVAGQPAHPQQLQVAAQLPLRDAEVGGRLGERDPGAGQQVGHERQQPGKPVGDPACVHAASAGTSTSTGFTPPPRAGAPSRCAHSASAGGSTSERVHAVAAGVAPCGRRPRPPSSPARARPARAGRAPRRPAPWPASQRATVSRLRSSSSISSPGRPAYRRGPTTRPRRRNPYARPSATHTRAVPTTGAGSTPPRTMASRSTSGRHRHHARRADRPHRPDDAGQPERARRRPVAVVADQVPAAPPGHHAPRLHRAPRDLARRAAPPVVERAPRARPAPRPAAARTPARPPRTRGCARPRSSSTSTPAARSFTNAPVRGAGQLRRLPQPRGQRHGGRLVGLEVDLAELVVLAGDAVAVGGVESRAAPALQRHAQLAQLGLVALEHPEERLVVRRVGVAGHDRADPLGGQELAGGQQAEHQVHQTLGPGGGHVRHRTAAPAGSWAAGEPGGRLILRHPRGVT